MNSLWLESWLTFKNSVDQSGRRPFILRISIYAWLNIVMIALILHPLPPSTDLWTYLASQYVYFIPMLALGAAVGTYETDLFAGTGELLLFSRAANVRGRLLSIAAELAIPLLSFAALFIYTGKGVEDWITMLLMTIAFTWLGLSSGFLWGFQNEKSVNNFCNAIIWILGFGPGPFMGLEGHWYQALFPGTQAVNNQYGWEWSKLAVYIAIAFALQLVAERPRAYRFFAK